MPTMNILKLTGGHAFEKEGRAMAASNEPMPHVTNLDQYKLATTNVSDFNVLVITDFIDQEYLFEQKHIIEQFLNDGKIVLACTHIFRNWLPGVNPFMPKIIYKHTDYEMTVVNEHPLFQGVNMHELTYRKGVSGFYARGYHPLTNMDAEIVLTFTDGTPITYIDRTTTKGTIVVHAARDLLSYATGDNSTQLIAKQTLQWIEQELTLLEEEKKR